MNVEVETLGIPETEYLVTITTPAHKFQQICTHLSTIGDVGMMPVGAIVTVTNMLLQSPLVPLKRK